MSNGSVTQWVLSLQAGEMAAAQNIWERYLERLIRQANIRLAHTPKLVADAEDVATKAFMAFLNGVELRRFSKLGDRHELWTLLVTLVERKAIDQIRWTLADRRGGGKVRGESAFFEDSVNGPRSTRGSETHHPSSPWKPKRNLAEGLNNLEMPSCSGSPFSSWKVSRIKRLQKRSIGPYERWSENWH